MAKLDYVKIGRILGLICGFIIIVNGVLRLSDNGFGPVDFIGSAFGGIVSGIFAILTGIVLIAIYLNKITIKDTLMLVIVYIVLGLLSGCVTAILAGIVVLLDKLIK